MRVDAVTTGVMTRGDDERLELSALLVLKLFVNNFTLDATLFGVITSDISFGIHPGEFSFLFTTSLFNELVLLAWYIRDIFAFEDI